MCPGTDYNTTGVQIDVIVQNITIRNGCNWLHGYASFHCRCLNHSGRFQWLLQFVEIVFPCHHIMQFGCSEPIFSQFIEQRVLTLISSILFQLYWFIWWNGQSIEFCCWWIVQNSVVIIFHDIKDRQIWEYYTLMYITHQVTIKGLLIRK